jgi:hypothetical protein
LGKKTHRQGADHALFYTLTKRDTKKRGFPHPEAIFSREKAMEDD